MLAIHGTGPSGQVREVVNVQRLYLVVMIGCGTEKSGQHTELVCLGRLMYVV